jgi:tetraacyldisaccharide 4'-kinase
MSLINNISESILKRIIDARNRRFDNYNDSIYHASKPVISIGNLTFGGSGKTPMAITIANEIIGMGFTPCIIGRGYKRLRDDSNIVSDGSIIADDWKSAGDEMFLIANKIKAPVIVHNKKFLAAKLAEDTKSNCIIVDDGFQHRQLHRDIDILIIDKNTIDKPWLPPKGKLREPIYSAERADFILSHEGLDMSAILPYCSKSKFVNYKTVILEPESKNNMDINFNKPLIAVSGIANPERFRIALLSKGLDIAKHIVFRDHYAYKLRDVENIIRTSQQLSIKQIITTEKDEVKLNEFLPLFNQAGINLLTLPISIELTHNSELLMSSIKNLIVKNYE